MTLGSVSREGRAVQAQSGPPEPALLSRTALPRESGCLFVSALRPESSGAAARQTILDAYTLPHQAERHLELYRRLLRPERKGAARS